MTPGPTTETPSHTELDKWFSTRNFALFLGFLIFSTFPKAILGRETFFYRDFDLFCYPWAVYQRDSIWQGTIPLWNPYNNCGVPFLAQWNTMVLYPPSLLYLILPMSWAVGVSNLCHLFLAGLGMYLLAYRWTRNRPAACVAGLAYVCNGVMLHSVMWTNYIAGLAWMPLVVLMAQKAWQEGGIRNIVLAALVGAMDVLTGAPEPILLTWGIVGVLWVVDVFRGRVGLNRQFWIFPAVSCLVIGLTAAQMFPFLDLLRHSQRNVSDFGEARWSMPGWGWANFVLPLFRCTPSILGVFSQDDQQFFSSYYLGIGTLALALIAVWQIRDEKVYLLALLAVAGVFLAMGENSPVYLFARKIIPFIKVIRYPIKFVVLTTFATPLLAALALRAFLGTASQKVSPIRRQTFLLCVVGIPLLVLLTCIAGYARFFPTPGASWGVTLESGASRAAFLVLILGSLSFLGRAVSLRGISLGVVVLLLLIVLDGVTHTANQNPTVTRACYGPLGIEKQVTAQLGETRAMVHPRLQAFLSQAAIADPIKYCTGIRRALLMDCNLLDRIPVATGFFSISPHSYARLDSVLNDPRKEPPQPLLDFLGVSQISAPDPSFTWQDRTNCMPLASAGQLPLFAGAEETLAAVSSPQFDPRGSVFLPLEARGVITVTNRSAARITRSVFSDQDVQLAVQADQPAIVVVAQTFYHNWRATVDGAPAKLWEANSAFQALEVSAGNHQIRLTYYDRMFKLGRIISLGSLALCLSLWFLRTKEQKT